MSDSQDPDSARQPSIFNQPWGHTWRKALVSLPRLVPDAALRITSPDGPRPIVTKLPSRGKHLIPVYIFIPPSVTAKVLDQNQSRKQISCPVLLDFHGGGFVLGSCQEQAPFCAKLCRELDCIAITVDYRLGPYAKFPAALEDAEDVLHAIISPSRPGYNELRRAINSSLKSSSSTSTSPSSSSSSSTLSSSISIDTTRLALSGFSSGGNLALNLALTVPATPPYLSSTWPSPLPTSHDTPIPLLLFYPALDTRLLPHERPLPKGSNPPSGFLASLNLEAELMPTYLPANMTSHPRASPCLVPLSTSTSTDINTDTSTNTKNDRGSENKSSTLHSTAKILLILPELDAITPQSHVWVERVKREGRGEDLSVVDVSGVLHGWTQFPDPWLDEVARRRKMEVFERAVVFTREVWGGEVGI